MTRTRKSAKAAGSRFEREEWRPIPGWETHYEASSIGRIRSIPHPVHCGGGRTRITTATVLKPRADVHGRPHVNLCRDGACRNHTPGSLVAAAFHGSRPNGMLVRHLNDDPWDNRPENLAYGTKSENTWDCIANGNHNELAKTHCPRGHELNDQNLTAASARRGYRDCLACNRARAWIAKRGGDLQTVSDRYYREGCHAA